MERLLVPLSLPGVEPPVLPSRAVQDRSRLVAFGRAVRRERQAKRWTVDHLGHMAQVSAGYLWQIEAGRANPSLRLALRIAAALQLPMGALTDAE